MSTFDQNQTVTSSQKEEFMEVRIIDQKFQDIKNRLKEQGSETSTQKNIQFNKDFCMESICPFDKKDYSEQISNSLTGAVSKYKSELSEKNIFSELNKNGSQNESRFEFPKKSVEKQDKENHHRLSSYQSSLRQVSVISENAEYQKNIEDDHVSVKIEKSEISKLSSTYVIYPMKDDSQSNSSLSRVQRDVPNKYKNYTHSRSNSRREGMLSFSNNEENIIKYNYMNEAQSLFKDEDSKNFVSETDQLSQLQNTQRGIKFSKILTQDEIKVLDKEAKQDYIQFLKNEINQELKREVKYKQMQEEVTLLNKNFRLEKELQQTEQDNRKLQIWILEDKIQQIELEYEQKFKEKNNFDCQLKQLKEKIIQTNLSQSEKEDLINQTKIEIENDKSSFIQSNQQKNNLFNEQNQLKIELESQNQILEKFIFQNQENQKIFDENQNLKNEYLDKIEKLKIKLQQKETQIFGCKKEMRRIQDDIKEANEIKATIKEEQDMYETQMCFLKKQKLIFERDIENLRKKQKFEEEFIHYGDKNNNQLFEQIKQNRHYFENQKQSKQKLEKEIEDSLQSIEIMNKQVQFFQQQIFQIEENINKIVEVTNKSDQIFKNEDNFEETRKMIISLLRPNFLVSNEIFNLNEHSQVLLQSQKSKSFFSNKLKEQKNNSFKEGSIHVRCRSNIEDQLNITNLKESLSAKLKQINIDQHQNEDEIQTKRVFSDKALSPTELQSQKQFGFMGLGKNLNGSQKIVCKDEFEDELSQKTEDEAEPQVNLQNKNKCSQNYKQINLKNIDKLSKIESQQKLQSPFTIRSILTSQNGAGQETKRVNNEVSQKNMDMPLQQNFQMTHQPPLKQFSQKISDLKSFLTQNSRNNETKKNEEKQNVLQDRLNMVNQIRDCSPLKQNLPVQIFMKAQQKQKAQKKQTKSKEEKKNQLYFIDNKEQQQFVEINQKNEQLKNGEIRQIIFINDDFFNKNIYDKPAQKEKPVKNKVSSLGKQSQNNFQLHQSSRDQYYKYQDMYFQQEKQHLKRSLYQDSQENQKRSPEIQYQTFQNKQEYENFLQFQKDFYSSNTDFKDLRNQQEYVNIKAQPFKKKLSYNSNQQDQFNDQNNQFSQVVKMSILKSKNIQSKYSEKLNEKYAILQEMKQSQSGILSQNNIREKSNGSIQKQVAPQIFSMKKTVTDPKIDSYREKPPIYNQLQNKKILSSSQVENQYNQENQKFEHIKIAPLRKSITKRRDDSFNVSKKSEIQSLNNQSSSHFTSVNLQNPTFYKFQSRKNTPNYEVISVQSQKPVPIPPIHTQKAAQYFKQNDDNFSKSNQGYDQFLNKEIINSQLSTRSLYVAMPKNDLHKQNYYENASYENNKGKISSELNKRKSFLICESSILKTEKLSSHENNNLTFKRSTANNSINKINDNNSAHLNEKYQSSNIIQSQLNLNLKSNFAKKNLENYCAAKSEKNNEKYGLFSQRTENKSLIQQQQDTQIYKQQSYNHYVLKANTQTQSQSSIQNNSYQTENYKQDHEFSLMQKDKQQEPIPINFNQKYSNAIENYDKYFKISSPEQKKNNQINQAFTPYYQNNLTQSHFASIEQQNVEKTYPSISKCPIAIADQQETRIMQNIYTVSQPFVKTQIQFKSNFGKQKFDYNLESQKAVDYQYNNMEFEKTPLKDLNSNSQKSSAVQKSKQSQLSQFLKPNAYQINEFSNNQLEQKSQNQSHLEKMQQELKLLQAQIGDGIISQNANTPKEPKSVLVGNQKKRERMENDLCFDRQDLYGDQMDLNSQRHQQAANSMDFLMKEQAQSSLNIGDISRKDSQSDITTKTYQTKTIHDQQYILQDQNIKVTQGSVAGRSINNTYIEMTDNRNLQNTVEELSEEQLRSQSDEMASNYENDQDNTYLSLKDQADIVAQLRSCKTKF